MTMNNNKDLIKYLLDNDNICLDKELSKIIDEARNEYIIKSIEGKVLKYCDVSFFTHNGSEMIKIKTECSMLCKYSSILHFNIHSKKLKLYSFSVGGIEGVEIVNTLTFIENKVSEIIDEAYIKYPEIKNERNKE